MEAPKFIIVSNIVFKFKNDGIAEEFLAEELLLEVPTPEKLLAKELS